MFSQTKTSIAIIYRYFPKKISWIFENNSIIYGDNGHIIVSSPWLPENKSCLEIYKKDQHYKFFSSTDKSVYAQQISNVSNLIENNAVEGKFPNINLKESTEIMKLISEWKEKIKL